MDQLTYDGLSLSVPRRWNQTTHTWPCHGLYESYTGHAQKKFSTNVGMKVRDYFEQS